MSLGTIYTAEKALGQHPKTACDKYNNRKKHNGNYL